MDLKKLKSNLRWRLRRSFAFMIFTAMMQLQVLLLCVGLGPLLLFWLVFWMQANFFPLGVVLFWSVYIPVVVGGAAVDYSRKRSKYS